MTLKQVTIISILLIAVLFILTFLAFYVISGNQMRFFRSAGIIFSIITMITILIIFTGDAVVGMISSVGALIAFLIIYFWHYYTPKRYIRNVKKQIVISEKFENI